MKFKVLPEPAADVERVAEMQAAVPLVPDGETSCCARLMQRRGVPAQDRAKEWLTFLRALRLVEEEGGEYRRLPHAAEPGELREAFVERVYLAEDVVDLLASADEPLDAEAVFESLSDRLPQWERHRHTDPEDVWRERVFRILAWAVVLGLAARTDDDSYVAATDVEAPAADDPSGTSSDAADAQDSTDARDSTDAADADDGPVSD